MRTNAEVDFEMSQKVLKMLKNFKHIKDYGQEQSAFQYMVEK